MEIELTVFEITLQEHTLVAGVFTNIAFQILSFFVQSASDIFVIFVMIPNLGHPIHASGVRPPKIILRY